MQEFKRDRPRGKRNKVKKGEEVGRSQRMKGSRSQVSSLLLINLTQKQPFQTHGGENGADCRRFRERGTLLRNSWCIYRGTQVTHGFPAWWQVRWQWCHLCQRAGGRFRWPALAVLNLIWQKNIQEVSEAEMDELVKEDRQEMERCANNPLEVSCSCTVSVPLSLPSRIFSQHLPLAALSVAQTYHFFSSFKTSSHTLSPSSCLLTCWEWAGQLCWWAQAPTRFCHACKAHHLVETLHSNCSFALLYINVLFQNSMKSLQLLQATGLIQF